jgi:uncharacterized membrane protein YccC
LSTRLKEAIKTGLAMAIAYGVALSMGWDRPYWAGIAVAVISLSTSGQSLNKGASRMLGTGVGAIVALTLLVWFPQQRWAMLAGLALWVGFCSYMMTGPKRQYFWLVAGFVCLIIAVGSNADASNAFYVAMERALETGLGILVYTVVSVCLWPQNSSRALDDATRALFGTQAGLYRTYLELMAGRGRPEDSRPQRLQQARLLAQLGQALGAAESDTYEVWEARHVWRRFLALSNRLAEALEAWRVSMPEVRSLDLGSLFPNLGEVRTELSDRIAGIAACLAGESPTLERGPLSLAVDRERLGTLSHFERAAASVTRTQIDRIGVLSRDLLDCVRVIRGLAPLGATAGHTEPEPTGWSLDPDRLETSLRNVTGLCLAFLLWVFVDPPGHASFMMLGAIFAMVASTMPTVSPFSMLGPFALGCAMAGVIHIVVMPGLVGYEQLGLVIFAATAAIYYVFAAPSQGLAKLGGIIPVLVLISVENQQTYSFSAYANSSAMLLLAIALANVTAYLPPSPRPEKRFLRLTARFFRRAELLVSQLALDGKPPRRATFLHSDLLGLPIKLETWGAKIDHSSFRGTTPEQVQELVASLHVLAHRIESLREARGYAQADLLVDHLLGDVTAWRRVLQQGLRRWAEDPGAELSKDIAERLAARLETLERRTSETFDLEEAGQIAEHEYASFYRILGSYRGLAEAMIAHARLTPGVDMGSWREARF